MANEETVRCRKCRKVLIADTECLINAHGQKHQRGRSDDNEEFDQCVAESERSCLYISEDSYPTFIADALDKSSWTKGKLNCPGCQARLGSFNFISGSHCSCGSHIVPQVHLLVSKVDVRGTKEALPHPVSYPDRPVSLSASNTESLPVLISSGPPAESSRKTDIKIEDSLTSGLPSCNDTNTVEGSGGLCCLSNTSQDSAEKNPEILEASHNSQDDMPKKTPHHQVRQRRKSWQRGESEEGVELIKPRLKSSRYSKFHLLDAREIPSESSSENEDQPKRIEDIPVHLTCSVCLDLLYSPLIVQPCSHVFCEPCLRRVARRNPTETMCPLCRQIIGECLPSKELSVEVREKYPDLHQERQLFERKHNIQHLPLPWNRNFRLKQYVSTGGDSLVQMAGGWRPILLLLTGNALGLGSLALLRWYLESQKMEATEDEEGNDDLYQYMNQ